MKEGSRKGTNDHVTVLQTQYAIFVKFIKTNKQTNKTHIKLTELLKYNNQPDVIISLPLVKKKSVCIYDNVQIAMFYVRIAMFYVRIATFTCE